MQQEPAAVKAISAEVERRPIEEFSLDEQQRIYDTAAMDYVYWLNELSADEREAHWDRVDKLTMEMALTDFWHARRWSR